MAGDNELGRVVDPAALDADLGARARLVVQIPHGWADLGGGIEVAVPRRFACARCAGGGCDACGRSGAVRVPDELVGGTLHVPVPRKLGMGAEIRLPLPFGDDVPIGQLIVEVRCGDTASEGVWLPGTSRWKKPSRSDLLTYLAIALVPVVAALTALLTR